MIGKSALLLMPLLLNAREVAVKMLNPPVPPIAPVVEQLRASRITTVFCRSDNLFTNAGTGRNLREFRTLLAACGIKFYITAPVFLDPEAIEKDPGLAGVGSFGNPSKVADLKWYSFVCPARPEYRKRKMAGIVDQVRELRPDGLSLDFIRYFVHWEKVKLDSKPESIEKFCFCDHCIGLMSAELGLRFPAEARTRQARAAWVLANHREAWTVWKCEKITSTVRETAAAARSVVPQLSISLHGVPWTGQEYDGGRRVIAGQDLKSLTPYVDDFGPMCYFQMLGRTPEWVHDVVADYFRHTRKPPLPSAQASGSTRGEAIAPELFRRYIIAALKPPSLGVNLFSWERLKNDEEKLQILEQVLASEDEPALQATGQFGLIRLSLRRAQGRPDRSE